MSGSESVQGEWPSAEEKAKNMAQAKALRSQAEKGGLRFNAYLPPELACWLLGLVKKEIFHDPRPGIPAEEVLKKLKKRRPLPEPAVWVK
jgi:hypothetical protein